MIIKDVISQNLRRLLGLRVFPPAIFLLPSGLLNTLIGPLLRLASKRIRDDLAVALLGFDLNTELFPGNLGLKLGSLSPRFPHFFNLAIALVPPALRRGQATPA